ncbi:hypothetical protein ACHAPT_006171 [Fusarium lateritium]
MDSNDYNMETNYHATSQEYHRMGNPGQLLHHIFEDQVSKSPESCALEFFPHGRLTYQELNNQSNSLARFLREKQLSNRDVVALSSEKSPLLVVAVLAVLKAGMVWIPLPTDASENRIQYILETSKAGLILDYESHNPSIRTDLAVIHLNEMYQDGKYPPYPTTNLDHGSRSERDLCHILFTSGSTGTPKGVMIEHRAVRHNALELTKMFNLDSDTRTLQFAAPTFDIFGLDLFMTFACGGCLIMAPRELMMEDMTEFMAKTKTTYTQLTPTVIQTIDPERVSSLRVLASSGEALPQQLADRWRHNVKLFNAYGPTETIVCTVEDLSENKDIDATCVGREVPGLDVRLLANDEARSVPVGEVGEICVAGPQLLRGYLSSKGQFQPPECCIDDVRYYRTGDLGRSELSKAGVRTIRLIGRRDAEVKLRGIRIDLAEIERSIVACLQVEKCVVVMPRNGSASGSLSSFVVLSDLLDTVDEDFSFATARLPLVEPSAITCSALGEAKDISSKRLPSLTMPKMWWPIHEIPLTSSGKVDRFQLQSWLEQLPEQKLLDLIKSYGVQDVDHTAEASPEERQLQAVWAEVLLRPASTIPVTDSLADLGADSLDVIRMASKSRAAGVNVNAADIFSARTIRELIKRCKPMTEKKAPAQLTTLPPYRPFGLLPPARSLAPLLQAVADMCSVPVAAIEDVYPCTPYQTALMALDIKCPGSYICAFSWTLRQDVDSKGLQHAWDTLMSSQPALRNRLIWDADGQQFLQVQVRHSPSKWSELIYEESMSLGSDLCRGLALWDESLQKWTFRLKIHHSIIDGWSLQLMLNQLKRIYFGEKDETLDGAAYANFVQHQLNDRQVLQDASAQFWAEYLDGYEGVEFPPEPQDPHHDVHATDHQSLTVAIKLQDLASRFGVTPAVILYGITALILATHGDTEDVSMGLILAGRDAPVDGVFHMIGPAFACVPFRTHLDHQMPLHEFFQRVHSQILAINPHQQYGLEHIKKCGPGAATACQLKTLVVVQPEDERLAGEGLWAEVHGQTSGLADSIPFSLELVLAEDKVLINCNSDPAVLTQQHAQMVTEHLKRALESLSDLSTEQTVRDIQMSPANQDQRMLEWIESYGPAVDVCLHDLLKTSADAFSEHMAIYESATGQHFTFRELDLLSSKLAVFIATSCQVPAKSVVPIAMEKSALAIITIFAILKTGCAYLPLEPSWPLERVRRIVDDAGAASIICSATIADRYQSLQQQLILIDERWTDTERDTGLFDQVLPKASPSDLAVLMYTSGSTGMPKGVMLEHRALSTSLTHLARCFALQPGDRHLQFSSFVYDVSISDIFIPLLSGVCICVPTDDDRLNRLSETIRRMEINSATLTPSMTGLISLEDGATLKTIMTGGEMTNRALIRTWAPRIRFLNAYGPTEASITTTVTDPLMVDSDPGVIGRNVTGWHMILRRDQRGQLYEALLGCTGEIAIAGHSLARGYLHNAELSDKSFVTLASLQGSQLPSRVYLTGDIGRYEQDGSVRILGRRDRMMKINGIRVDPGEAEDQLRKLEGQFSSAVVQCTIDDNKVSRLTAFVTVNTDNVTNNEAFILPGACNSTFREMCHEAQSCLLEVLPVAYVPTIFVPVRCVPSTASDKVDLKRLRDELQKLPLAPFIITADAETKEEPVDVVELETPTELVLENVLRTVFHTQGRLGAAADFFRLGGDSFTAIKLVSVAKEHNLDITVQQIYRHPRLRDLAAVARYKRVTNVDTEDEVQKVSSSAAVSKEVWKEVEDVMGISASEIEDVYPVSPFQEGLMATSFNGSMGDDKAAYHAKMVFQLSRETDTTQLTRAMEKVVSRNPILRTRLVSLSAGPVQVVVKHSTADQRQPSRADTLFQYQVHTGSSQHPPGLIISMHHALYDAPTMHLLMQDIDFWYGKPDGVKPLPTPYRKFVDYLDATDSESASRYWTEALRNAPLTPFPQVGERRDRTRATQHLDLSTTVSLGLLQESGISAATSIAGAMALLLSSYSFADQVCFGMTLSGRDNPDLEAIMGPTLSTVPMHVHVTPEQSMNSLLQQIQDSILDMRQHQHFGLKNIMRLPGQGPRNASQFRTLLVVHQSQDNEEASRGVIARMLVNESSMFVEYPLVIIAQISSTTGRVDFRVEFDPDCVSNIQARRFIHQLEKTMKELSLPDRLVSELDLISSADLTDVAAWNPPPPVASSRSICQMFQDVALRQPDLPAVEALVGERLGTVYRTTYKELDAISTALSQTIQRRAPNSPRIVLCHHTPSLVLTGMLAVWKANKAFTTMNPSLPVERRHVILSELGEDTVVLTDSSEAESFAPFQTYILDEMLQEVSGDQPATITHQLSDPAYVFFTSGSSGTPKGVMVRHSAIALSLSDVRATMGLDNKTRMLQFATCAFDTSLLETFATLIAGGCVCLPARSQRLDGNLGRAINQLQASHLVLTPTVAALLSSENLPSVKSLMLVGEPPSKQLIESWATTKIMNGYGPTEASVHTSTNLSLQPNDPHNIGRATACNLVLVVPDQPSKLAPIGAIGELVICGETVADGYLNQPGKTKDAFGINPPWATWVDKTSIVRYYRTGDLARYAADGSIIYMGRKDLQTKIHGQRLELSEIESHIRKSGRFTDCVVEVLPPATLVAFVLTGELGTRVYNGPLPAGQLDEAAVSQTQNHMKSSLPEYMVPAAYVPCECWPTTASGKIDRRRLRASVEHSLESYRFQQKGPKRPAKSPEQMSLFAIIAEVMSISEAKIGLDDSLFSLGGDSITMIRILALSRQRNLDIDAAKVFQSTTLENMVNSSSSQLPTHTNKEVSPPAPFSLVPWVEHGAFRTLAAKQCHVPVESIIDVYPCTAIQESLMVASAKTRGAFLNQEVFRLPSEISIDKLVQAVQALWQRHEILRTRIILDSDYRGLQVVVKEDADVCLTSLESLDDFLMQDSLAAFEYGAKLSRCAIITSNSISYLVLSQHHAVFDGWSMNLLKNEVQALYQDAEAQLPPTQPYSLFVKHSLDLYSSSEAHRYWKTQLADIQTGPLPQVRSTDTFTANRKHDLTVDFANKTPHTLSTLAEAAWAVFLGRYLDSEDVSFGVVRSGRAVPVPGIDTLIGPILATIPRRLLPVREQGVESYLQQVQGEIMRTIPWEQYGLSNIRKIDDNTLQACKFSSMLVIQPPVAEDSSAFLVPEDHLAKGFIDSDCLIVDCQPTGNGQVTVTIIYDDRLMSSDDAQWMVYHFSQTLKKLSTEQTTTIGHLNISGRERLDQEHEWNSVEIDTCHRLVDEIFTERASQWPDLLAVEGPDASLSYQQLETLSSVGASKLRSELGVRRGDLVPLLMTKGAAMVVAMLSVLKVGAAYVPLPIDAPLDRLRFIIQESGSQFAINTADHLHLAQDLSIQAATWDVEQLEKHASQRFTNGNDEDHNDESRSHSDLAYLLFTSGSSGTPKGVMIEHAALATTALVNGHRMGYQVGTRTLSFAAYTFDVNVIEIYLTLLHGGCLYIPPEDRRLGDLCSYVNEKQIELAFLTPTTIQNLLQSPSRVPSLKTLRSGGEPLSKSIMEEWSQSVRLINSYGPTETCVDACRNPTVTTSSDPNNIGFSIGTYLWVVNRDDYNSPAPIGCPGELLISGPTLARGYFKDEERTQAAFIDGSQFPWTKPGYERFYATGDIVQRNADGSITYVGRRDLQVKLNGFRIELGEIEYNLEQYPSMASAVVDKVTLQSDGSGVLVAFFTLTEEDSCKEDLLLPASSNVRTLIQGIQTRLEGKLPPYMVPRAYLPLSHIPLTLSGKTDRRSLRQLGAQLAPDQMLLYQGSSSVIREPSTIFERILQGLWAQVLKIDLKHLGLDTQFTRVGGDSLRAISLASLCRGVGLKLEVADILRVPQLEQMANHLERNQSSTSFDEQKSKGQAGARQECDPELRPQVAEACNLSVGDIEDVFPCTPTQEALMAATVRQTGAYIDHSMFTVPSSTDIHKLRASWDIVHQSNPILRTRICSVMTGSRIQMVQAVTRHPGEWIDSDSKALEMGLGTPLIRYRIRPSGNSFILEIWRHHSIFDGFSSMALWQDLEHAFTSSTSPKPRPSFRTFVDFVQGADKDETMSFWRTQLEGHQREAFPALPAPDYAPEAHSATSQTLESTLNWTSDSPFSFATIARAAWAVILGMRSRTSDADKDICFAATVSGRTAPLDGIEDIVGPTITTTPVRLQFSLDDTVPQILKHVHDQALAMLPFEHFGLSHIRDVSTSARDACASMNLLVVQPSQLAGALPLGLQRMAEEEAADGLSEPFGLVMECSHNPTMDQLSVSAAYDPSLLTASEVVHILQQFEQMIGILHRGACGNSSIRSALWELAEGADLERTIQWNSSGDIPPPTQLHELVEETAQLHPDQIAIDCHDGQMSYAELVAASEALAFHLQEEYGVRPGQLVPICAEKSRFMIVAIIAVMKAGAGYVPLDTNHPEARTELILNEVQAKFVVVSPLQASRKRFPVQTLVLDSRHLQAQNTLHILHLSSPNDVAYVIFTSGSTGTPKGVVMEHKAASRSILEHAQRYQHAGQGTRRRSLQFSSYTFDASVVDIFAVLASGGCLCVPSESQGVDALESFIQQKQINFADITPTVANLLEPSNMPSLRTLAVGGEMANRALLRKWTSSDSPVELMLNAYGPTEAGIACAMGQLTETSAVGQVGKRLAAGLWIVDDLDHNHLVPIGSVGELAVTGSTLARGYLNDPKKTKEAFLENVSWLAKVGEQRLYKTGDLARFDVNGHVELVGRREDMQIKFRGLRIELGEIEAAIGASFWAKRIQRVAVTKMHRDEIPLLAAFVQLDGGQADPAEESIFCLPSEEFASFIEANQQDLQMLLPDYMVPQLWLPVSNWPLMASSKTDRKQLIASAEGLTSKRVSEYQQTSSVKGQRAASTKLCETEEAIKEAWLQVLHKDSDFDIQPQDDFFRLGGDSLTAIMLVAVLRRSGIYISAQDVFVTKTLGSMAARCGGLDTPHRAASESRDMSPATPDSSLKTPLTDTSSETSPTSLDTSHVSTKELLTELWTSVANLPARDYDDDDDFFECGGDNLGVFRLAEDDRLRLSSADIYAHPTLAGMASRVWSRGLMKHSNLKSGSRRFPIDIGVDEVEAIYPASYTQTTFLIEAQKWARSYYAWTFFELDDCVAPSRVRSACQTLVDRHAILRTSFHLQRGRCFQVVHTSRSRADFKVILSQSPPDKMCSLVDRDIDRPVQFGQIPTRFRLLIDQDSGVRTIAMGLSHAQYDGFSLTTIFNDLRSAYCGLLIEPTASPGYRRFIQHTLELSTDKTDNFWRELLQGSALTAVSNLSATTQQPVMSESSMQTIPFQFKKPRHASYNYGTLLRAAWALTLSAISGSTDVAFWNLVSGRFAPFQGAQEVVGPCINFVPVRVRLDASQPVSDLVSGIHEQHIQSIPFEATPTNRIIQQAQWPRCSSGLGTIFQYQNIPDPKEHSVEVNTPWTVKGSAVYGGGLVQSGACWLLAWPSKDGQSSFRFTYSPQTLSSSAAKSVVETYLSLVHAINDLPQDTVASILDPATNPLPAHVPEPLQPQTCTTEVTPTTQSIMSQIESCWKEVLEISNPIGPDQSLFDLGGDSLTAAELAGHFEKAGLDLRLQDILDFPTLRLQTLLLFGHITRPERTVPKLEFRSASELS